jgi:AbrB family looped-hinge helix DNA binding protein
MKIFANGRVTIPKEFRDLCGLHPYTEVKFTPVEGGVAIEPVLQASKLDKHIGKTTDN